MAIRNIVKDGDPILKKKCRPVEKFDRKLAVLLEDMAETMHLANGVGLAAPQVGMLRRVVVIDVGEGVIELVNPEIIAYSGEQCGLEGCLSFPGEWGLAKRPTTLRLERRTETAKCLKSRAESSSHARSATKSTTSTALFSRTL